ncbi:energy transducer TonB [Fangia hongkongensis]|uniref:energy transducer TonB n=1 Tax=Fangia hongkongensis TaxID=270495 RepID=UPI000374D07D|nr:energy transducer TonB [Fangia hongkongensis]MBK2125834.1 energy transducer TonB [Fangia hongkongensis]
MITALNKSKFLISLLLASAVNGGVLYAVSNKIENHWQLKENTLSVEKLSTLLLSADPSVRQSSEKYTQSISETVDNNEPPEQKTNQSALEQKKDLKEKKDPLQDKKKVNQNNTHQSAQIKEKLLQDKAQKASPKINQHAKVRYAPPPLSYPKEAIDQNIQGKVKLLANIDVNGNVESISIIQSSGFGILDQAAKRWFKKLQFFPALKESAAVPSTIIKTVSFSLKDH